LTDLGHHLVGQGDEVPLVDRDPRPRQRGADAGGVGGGRVDHHQLDRRSERLGLLAEPGLHAAASPARRQPDQTARAIGGAVDEAGQPRVRPSPGDAVQPPAHGPEPSLINPQPGRRCRLGQPPVGGRDQGPMGCRPGHAVLPGHLRHRPVPGCDRRRQLLPQPLRHPRPWPDRLTGLGERPPWAQRLDADQPAFPPPQLRLLTARRKVRDPPQRPVLDPTADHPARRTGTLPADRFDDDLDLPRREPADAEHVELVLDPEQHCRSLRHTRGLAAGRCERPTACRGREPLRLRHPAQVRRATLTVRATAAPKPSTD
jgi:hypothetical protein